MSEKDGRRRFLTDVTKTVVGAAALATGISVVRKAEKVNVRSPASESLEESAAEVLRTGQWRNWSGNQRSMPRAVVRPANLSELQKAVASATTARAVGSSHSISSIARTEDTLILTDRLNRFIWLDRARGQVKVEAGIKLAAFNDAVAAWGWALPSTGDTNYQSLAGLLSTGTHGTGMKWGSCSDEQIFAGIELVLADGTLLQLQADRESDRELLEAARIGLGSLGVVYSVTLNLVPIHNLEHFGRRGSLDEALDPRHLAENDHYEFAYFPFTDTCYMFFRNKTTKPTNMSNFSRWFYREFLENDLAHALLGVSSHDPKMIPSFMRTFAGSFPAAHQIDRCDQIMTIQRESRTVMMEYALPLARARDSQDAFQRIARDFSRKRGRERFYVNLPTQVRFIRGDRGTLLSTTQGQDSCFVGVGNDVRHKGSEPMFRAMEDAFLSMGGRPHWGKLFYKNPCALHPNWGRFMAIREKLDPKGKFINPYMRQMQLGMEL